MPRTTWLRLTVAACMLLGSIGHADPLQRAASKSALAPQRLVLALAQADGGPLVAVGQRGHVMLSGDGGERWTQASVPLSSDLTALQFVGAQRAYAVGHDGVVLRSDDGGQQWRRVLDGTTANTLALTQHQQAKPDAEHERLLAELQRNVDAGPDKPFLDLHFSSADEGFVIGAYNLIFQTRDGGQTWQSWYARTDNSTSLLNLYAIRTHRNTLFVVGEAGLLMRLDPGRQHFVRIDTGQTASFFGLLDAGEALIAYGMRGKAVISRDGGSTWRPLDTGLQASITASSRGADGRLWLADQFGQVSVSRDGGATFVPVKLPMRMPLAAIHAGASRLVLAGARGVHSLPLPKD